MSKFFEKEHIYSLDGKGEVTQYYVTDDHEAIIDKKTFDAVQVEIKNRKEVIQV